MHRNPHKIDREASKAAHFLSRYSYVSLRIHPESDPPHQCIYLAGDDVAGARRACFESDNWRCVNCQRCISWETGEMDHGGKTKVQRCSCPENLSTKCRRCHNRKHNRQVQLRDLRREQSLRGDEVSILDFATEVKRGR